jgi:inorganic pyrophosphatase
MKALQLPIARFLIAERRSRCHLPSLQTASWYSSSSSNRRAVALTKSTFSTLAMTSRPTALNKIHPRAAIIAKHLHNSTTTSTTHSSYSNMAYTVRKIGAPNTLEHRIFIEENGRPLSPFHDIPLYANPEQTILNMVVEVPRWTNAKMEVRAISTLQHLLGM